MKQADLGLNLTTKRTRKREFLDEMNRVVPWSALVKLVGRDNDPVRLNDIHDGRW